MVGKQEVGWVSLPELAELVACNYQPPTFLGLSLQNRPLYVYRETLGTSSRKDIERGIDTADVPTHRSCPLSRARSATHDFVHRQHDLNTERFTVLSLLLRLSRRYDILLLLFVLFAALSSASCHSSIHHPYTYPDSTS